MRTLFRFGLLLGLLGNSWAQPAHAQVLAPQALEVEFTYSAQFLSNSIDVSAEDEALLHASHLFGIFQSQGYVESQRLNWEEVGGIAAPRWPPKIKILRDFETDEGRREIRYSFKTKALVQKRVAREWLRRGQVTLALPYDLSAIYDENCTDEHYQTEGDYWYFYDIYRRGCVYLQSEPYARVVSVSVTALQDRKIEASPRLDLLRGDNGNGDDFMMYVIYGFAKDSRDHEDEGRANFDEFNQGLIERGFSQSIVRRTETRPLYVSEKWIDKMNGERVHVIVKSLLVETAIESRGKTFAKFFREAVEQGDVVLYAGHSGLGGNLDIAALEEKAGSFVFDTSKKQIFFFDACSSYSYYLDPFRRTKTPRSVDILTYGLPSYFHTTQAVHDAFLDVMLDMDHDQDWLTVLKKMESPLEGGTYLLNVGGI